MQHIVEVRERGAIGVFSKKPVLLDARNPEHACSMAFDLAQNQGLETRNVHISRHHMDILKARAK